MPRSETGKYPYFVIPFVESYRQIDPESEEAADLRKLISVNIGDEKVLQRILGKDYQSAGSETSDYKPESHTHADIIDDFINKFGGDKTAVSNKFSFDSDELKKEDTPEEKLVNPDQDEEKRDLAWYMNNRRYREALSFIEAQNLNNPEKSIYFAHQIRFLKKLIKIEEWASKGKQ